MNIPFRSFTDTVRDMSAAITSSAGNLIDMSVGSVLRAIIEANAGIVSWIQWLIFLALQTTRAATSLNTDLDSWMADFSFPRLGATVATGSVTFSRLSTTLPAYVPVGTTVKTIDGLISFTVVGDSFNPAWHGDARTYRLDAGVATLSVPVISANPGITGNVQAGTVTLIASPVPGIDSVINAALTAGGEDPEQDDAFRKRFQDYFAARSKGTLDAIGYAVSQTRQGLSFLIQENLDAAGKSRAGHVLVLIDDGSGVLSESLSNAIANSIELVRPVGTTISLQAPVIITVTVLLSLEYLPDTPVYNIQSRLLVALRDYINERPIGGILSLTRISQLVYQTEPQIVNISMVLLNDRSNDLPSSTNSVLKFSNVIFN